MKMEYNPTNWKDHVTQYQNRYKILDNHDGTVLLAPQPGNIIQQGTPIDSIHLNNIENGIKNLYDNLSQVKVDLTSQNLNIIGLGLELETLKGSVLTGVNNDVVIETFQTLNNVTILSGMYDSTKHTVYIL